jgi:hypothetical protein
MSDDTVGIAYSQPFSSTGWNATHFLVHHIWAIAAGIKPELVVRVVSGTPSITGNFVITVRATDSAGGMGSQAFSMTVFPVPAVTTTSLRPGTAASPYSATLSVSGGKAPYTWTIAAGNLPTGVLLQSNTGEINGSPAAAGTFNFTVRVTDTFGASATKALSIAVAPALLITTNSLGGTTVGGAYSATLERTGGNAPFSWDIASGALPNGLSINVNDGSITGTPLVAGNIVFTARVTDSSGAAATRDLGITVAAPPVITATALPSDTIGAAYSQTIAVSGGTAPLTWSVINGSLPAGLTLASDSGLISGTPSVLGNFGFTVRVVDKFGISATQALSIGIVQTPTITTTSLPGATAGAAYSIALAAVGGISPYVWDVSSGSFPTGLTLASSTGIISGSPAAEGAPSFTVRVTDSKGISGSKLLSLTIAPPLSISTISLAGATLGVSYSATLVRSGGTAPFTWVVDTGSLPDGLSLNSSSGTISGTPTSTGTFNFTAKAADAVGAISLKPLSIVVATPLTISTKTLPSGTAGTAYSATLAADGGIKPYNWSVPTGLLPAGLTLNSATGEIAGTPAKPGPADFTVQASDSATPARIVTQPLLLNIIPAISISTTTLQPGISGVAYSQSISVTGGTPPYSWTVTSGALPAGLSLNASRRD